MTRKEAISLCAKLAEPIEELGLDTRAYNALKRAGKTYIGAVAVMEPKELMKIRNCGAKTAYYIIQRIEEYVGEIDWSDEQ